MAYIKFKFNHAPLEKKTSWFGSIQKLALTIIPRARVSIEHGIEGVTEWLVECDDNDGFPTREIGMNKNGEVVVIMPYHDHYGYWTGNTLSLADFHNTFYTTPVTAEEFERRWKEF